MTDASPSANPPLPTAQVIAVGIVALALAMGIGRFAFTPLLPLMLRDGDISAATGAEWAALNYAGYLIGALTAARVAGDLRRALMLGLIGVALTTLAVGVLSGAWLVAAGALLRTAAGVCSAWVLISVSSWSLADLARRGRSHLGAWIYTGVGLGVAAAGVLTWFGGRQPARWLWIEFGVLTLCGTWFVWSRLHASTPPVTPRAAASRAPSAVRAPPRQPMVVWCYGCFGFGYIIQATFLPTMARQQVSDPLVFGLTWPLFGLAAVLSVAVAARWMAAWPRRRVWALAQATMALGTALPLATRSLWALAVSALLVGGTFMVTTMAGLQLARERSPADPTPLFARMTSAFATGQIAGPVFVRLLEGQHWLGRDALFWANALATALLAASAQWLARGAGSAASSPAH